MDPPIPETHLLLQEMLRLLQEQKVVKPVDIPDKPCNKPDNTLVYVCIVVSVLMTFSALGATLSSMRWEAKYSKLVDHIVQMVTPS